MEDRELYFKMNDFVVNMHPWDETIYEELPTFCSFNIPVIELLEPVFSDYNDEIDASKIEKKAFYENIKLINEFYKKIGLKFNANNVIKNNALDYVFYDYDDPDKINRFKNGCNYYTSEDYRKEIEVCNNGLITDSIVLVHELSHYRNQRDKGRTIVGRFFTETLALTDELIYYDYLLNNGHKIDKNFIRSSFYFYYQNAIEAFSVMDLLLLFSEYGGITEKDYETFYNTTDDYKENIEVFKDITNDYSILVATGYNVSFLLAPYLFYKYKKNNDYFFLEYLNELINEPNIDTDDCFEEIGLNGIDEDDVKVLSKSIKRFTNEYLK